MDVVYHGTAISDLDEDSRPELAIGDYSGTLTVLNGEDGSLSWDYLWADGYYAGAPASIGDLFWHYSIPGYGSAFRGVVFADINGDVYPDVIFGTSEGHFIALNGISGSAIFNTDLSAHYGKAFDIDHAPVIADFNQDGVLDAFIIGGHAEYPNFENNYGRGYALSLGTGSGPDFDHHVAFNHNLPGTIIISDISGRNIKIMQSDGNASWDGRTDRNTETKAALYFARLVSDQGTACIKIVKK